MCIRDRPEILPERLRVRVHIAGLKIYESVADIVTALKQVGQLVEIDRQRTEHSLFGVINRHIERLRTRGCGTVDRSIAMGTPPSNAAQDRPSWRLATRSGVPGLMDGSRRGA